MLRGVVQTIVSFFQPVSEGGSGIRKTRSRLEELWNELSKDERSSIQWGVGPKEVCELFHLILKIVFEIHFNLC